MSGSVVPDASVQVALDTTALCRGDLVDKWREVSKPRGQGALKPQAKGAREDFAPLFDQWLRARNLENALRPEGYNKGWKIYRYIKEPVVQSDETWEQAFHGTWWYSLWGVLEAGVFLESNDRSKGHDYWEPGVYVSPKLATGLWYARPQVLFGDGVYHRVIYEVRVNTAARIRSRDKGGIQWIFKPDAVALHAIWIKRNSPPLNGEERINDWDPALEALPPGWGPVPHIVNPRLDDWPDPRPDEEGEADVWSDELVPPHLQGANPHMYPPDQPPAAGTAGNASYFSQWRSQNNPLLEMLAQTYRQLTSAPGSAWQAAYLADCRWCQKGECWTHGSKGSGKGLTQPAFGNEGSNGFGILDGGKGLAGAFGTAAQGMPGLTNAQSSMQPRGSLARRQEKQAAELLEALMGNGTAKRPRNGY